MRLLTKYMLYPLAILVAVGLGFALSNLRVGSPGVGRTYSSFQPTWYRSITYGESKTAACFAQGVYRVTASQGAPFPIEQVAEDTCDQTKVTITYKYSVLANIAMMELIILSALGLMQTIRSKK